MPPREGPVEMSRMASKKRNPSTPSAMPPHQGPMMMSRKA
jgi:hypothetical protein